MKKPDCLGEGMSLTNLNNQPAPYEKPVVTKHGQLRDLTAVTSGGDTLDRCPDRPGATICEPSL